MAFQNYEELVSMASSNPKKAMSLVNRAQKSSTPVVSRNNPGYGDSSRAAALRRRFAMKQTMKDEESQTEEMVNKRKGLNY